MRRFAGAAFLFVTALCHWHATHQRRTLRESQIQNPIAFTAQASGEPTTARGRRGTVVHDPIRRRTTRPDIRHPPKFTCTTSAGSHHHKQGRRERATASIARPLLPRAGVGALCQKPNPGLYTARAPTFQGSHVESWTPDFNIGSLGAAAKHVPNAPRVREIVPGPTLEMESQGQLMTDCHNTHRAIHP